MIDYQAGDFLLVQFPFASGNQGKARPALVLLDSGDIDVLVARMTTKGPFTPYDLKLTDWQAAGLKNPGVVRLHKLASIEKTLVHHPIGKIQPVDRQRVAAVLDQMFGNW